MNCPKCGSEITEGQKFCTNCGADLYGVQGNSTFADNTRPAQTNAGDNVYGYGTASTDAGMGGSQQSNNASYADRTGTQQTYNASYADQTGTQQTYNASYADQTGTQQTYNASYAGHTGTQQTYNASYADQTGSYGGAAGSYGGVQNGGANGHGIPFTSQQHYGSETVQRKAWPIVLGVFGIILVLIVASVVTMARIGTKFRSAVEEFRGDQYDWDYDYEYDFDDEYGDYDWDEYEDYDWEDYDWEDYDWEDYDWEDFEFDDYWDEDYDFGDYVDYYDTDGPGEAIEELEDDPGDKSGYGEESYEFVEVTRDADSLPIIPNGRMDGKVALKNGKDLNGLPDYVDDKVLEKGFTLYTSDMLDDRNLAVWMVAIEEYYGIN